jgi:ParB family chromosome partitioning protein
MSLNTSVLGRGLGSLLGQPSTGQPDGSPLFIAIDRISANPDQPRQYFDDGALMQLARSIREQGILQPLLLSPGDEQGKYQLIAGERRLRAAKMAGLVDVPVVIRKIAPAEAFELALIENIQRRDLNPIEEAEAFQRLLNEYGYSQAELAERVGKDRTTITNSLRLLKLQPELRAKLLCGTITAGHARALLGAPDLSFQLAVANRIETAGLSVRAVERLIAENRRQANAKPERQDAFSAERKSFRQHLQTHLGRPIRIRTSNDTGSLTITFTDHNDLKQLVDKLSQIATGN